jgi:5-methylcytosine-specific restriction endonuclease McrA
MHAEGDPLPIPLPSGHAFVVSREQAHRPRPEGVRAHVVAPDAGTLCGARYVGPYYGATTGHGLCIRCLDVLRTRLAQADWDAVRAAAEAYHFERFVAEPERWAAATAAAFPRMAGHALARVPSRLVLRPDVPPRRGRRQAISARVRLEIFERDGWRCRYCGASPREAPLTIDHVHAVANGGTNAPANLVTACLRCNVGKGTRRASPPRSAP